MKTFNRYTLRAAGESGMGLNSVGDMLAQALKEAGLYTFSYREFPSLIKGGYAFQQVDISDEPLASPSRECDLLVALSRVSFHKYLSHLRPNGLVLYSFPKLSLTPEEETLAAQKNLQLVEVPAMNIAFKAGGTYIMLNTVLNGLVWKIFGLELDPLEDLVRRVFEHKPKVIDPNLACLRAGYEFEIDIGPHSSLEFELKPGIESLAAITGNHAIGLGAVAGGVRAYFAYPMSPSSSILSYLAEISHETGMFVKQIEDEIAVANMTVGAMHMGTRALCATSGGGFDLMTETVSLAAMTETPFVCVVAQRPGPATGLPTWSSASDLNLAIYGGHGEYTRLVLAASDPKSCYELTQVGLNLAEKYQIPVILLTEKQIAESLYLVDSLPEPLPIERGLVAEAEVESLEPSDRYKITKNGVSKRWLPGTAQATYDANSDEHWEDGSLTEEAENSREMYDKRLRKMVALRAELPEPTLHGPETAGLTLVGWGSVKTSVLDAISYWNTGHAKHQVNYLHYEYMYPLRTEKLLQTLKLAKKVVLIEQNALGQLGQLIKLETGYDFTESFLKYDGRPFFIEELYRFFQQKITSDTSRADTGITNTTESGGKS